MSEPNDLPYVIRAEQRVAAPPAAVWAVLADFGNVHRWSPTVTASRLTSTAAAGPGCSRACDIRGMGRIEETVTAWDEGRGFTYVATPLGPMGAARNRWTVTAVPGGSVVAVEFAYRLRYGVLGRALHALAMRKKLARLMPVVLAQLATHVERAATVRAA